MWSVAAPAVVAMILLFLGGWRSKAESFDTPGAGKEIQLEKAPASLELRLTSPPRWEKNCLVVSLDRISHSSVPVFLTSMGPYFYMALNVTSEGSAEPTTEWINIQGIVDIKSSNAYPLAPDAVAHDTYCLPSAVWVINPNKKTRRELPLRGKLRVDVSYFLTEESWKTNRGRFIDPSLNVDREAKSSDEPSEIAPKWARILAAIPCSVSTCTSHCDDPPMGLPGEFRPVPDVYYILHEWNERGKAVTEELSRKSHSCSEEESHTLGN